MNQDDPISTGQPGKGKLYVVATPIGNMEDITLRTIRILSHVDLIAAEDTRHTGKLLSHYKIVSPMISCHEHNEDLRSDELISRMKSGMNIALVSNAGTPLISDPGYRLVQKSISAGIQVIPVPGVSSVIAALSASGLATDAFIFIGFVPRKPGKRQNLLESLEKEPRTLVFFESPHRILNLVDHLLLTLGDRHAVLAREITKLHEEFIRGHLSQLKNQIESQGEIKGECILLVEGMPADTPLISEDEIDKELIKMLDEHGEKLSGAVKKIARRLGISRKKVYNRALKLKKGSQESSH